MVPNMSLAPSFSRSALKIYYIRCFKFCYIIYNILRLLEILGMSMCR
jgi:hypothetical protein